MYRENCILKRLNNLFNQIGSGGGGGDGVGGGAGASVLGSFCHFNYR